MKKLFLSVALYGASALLPVMAFEPFTVKSIKVEGLARVSQEAVLEDLPITVGETIDSAKASAAIHDLYASGYYSNVSLERQGDVLVVRIIERPSIGKLELVGLRTKDDVEKILKENNIAEGRVYNPTVMDKVEKEIFNYYLMKQKYGVKIDTKVKPLDRNRVEVEIHIYEGDVATIREIKFVGNEAFTEKQLRAQMFHKTANWLSWFDKSDHYSKEKLAADLEMIRSFYYDRGYASFAIESTQVALSPDKEYVYLTINISEGPQYFFSKVTLDGDMVVPREKLDAIIDKSIKSGAAFSRKAIWEVKDQIEALLGEEGYSKAQVRIMDEIDPNNRTVGIKFYIDANQRITVRRISFSGNDLTQDPVLRRDIEQFEGTWISTQKIKEGKEAIMRDGYATNIEVITQPVLDKSDQVDIIYKIDEARNMNISAGLSYTVSERLAFNVGAELKNFVGTGKDINFLFNRGKATQTYTFGYSDQYFTASGIGLGFNVYDQKQRLNKTSNVNPYVLDTTGFNAIWQFRISKYNYLKAGFGYDHAGLKMNYQFAPTQAQYFVQSYNSGLPFSGNQNSLGFKEYFLTGGWVHNSLDNYLFPTKGATKNIEFKLNLPSSLLKLYRVDAGFGWFKTIKAPYVLNIRANVGYANVFDNKPYPFFKNYYLGGPESVRGYKERSLGPVASNYTNYGGNFMVEARLQLIFPPPFVPDVQTVRLSTFIDAGQVYATSKKGVPPGFVPNPHGIKYSAGVSVTWNTPLHVPITISLAAPLHCKASDKINGSSIYEALAISMGTQF